MLPKLVAFDHKTPAGMYPDAVANVPVMWDDAANVEFGTLRILASGNRSAALNISTFPVRGMGAVRTYIGVQELYFGTLDKLYRSAALASPSEVGTGFSTQQHETTASLAGHWHFVPWGEWMLASNGTDRIQIRKGTGNFVDLQQGGTTPLDFARARVLTRLGPHVIAMNIPDGPSTIRWCSDDDIEDWVTLETNTAGDFVIRDTVSEIVASAKLGERLSIYTRDEMYTMTYIGAPFVFGVLPALQGIGAHGPRSVAAVGRENYGWGPSGIWRTDGTQFQHLDDGIVREWLQEELYEDQASKIVCYHNEKRHRVEWFYPTTSTGENSAGIAYDYLTNAFSRITYGYTAVLERDVFQYSLGAAPSTAIYAENAGDPSGASLTTKAFDLGEVTFPKFLSQARVHHKGTITLEMGYADEVNATPTWLPAQEFTGSWDAYEIHRSARFWFARISGAGPWSLSGFELYGRPSGRRR